MKNKASVEREYLNSLIAEASKNSEGENTSSQRTSNEVSSRGQPTDSQRSSAQMQKQFEEIKEEHHESDPSMQLRESGERIEVNDLPDKLKSLKVNEQPVLMISADTNNTDLKFERVVNNFYKMNNSNESEESKE